MTRDIDAFMSRDWESARENKDQYWAERIARLGAGEGLRIADELRRQVIRQDPGWPDPTDRHNDLLAHVRLAMLLRRARPASRR